MVTSRVVRSLKVMIVGLISAAVLAGVAPPTGAAELQLEERANWWDGIYVSFSAGGQTRGIARESQFVFTEWDPGYAGSLAVGYRVTRYFRFDGEISAFHNDADILAGGAPNLIGPADGSATLRAAMFSAYFDFPIRGTGFAPYVGGGVGFYKSYLNELTNGIVEPFGFTFDGGSEGERFAYHIRAGVSYAVTPALEIFVGYRFFHGDKLDFTFQNVPAPGQTFTAGPEKSEFHVGEIGLRYTF